VKTTSVQRKQRAVAVLLVGVFAAACSGDGVASSAGESVELSGSLCQRSGSTEAELPLPADLEAVFDPVVTKGMVAMEAVGLTFAVQCAESPLYVKGYGSADLASGVPATADTVYEIGSISKQFVAANIMVLIQEGRLSLDDPIGMYLSWLPSGWQSVTLRQLLSHTGGVPDHFAIFREDPETPFDWTGEHSAEELVIAFLALDDRLVAAPGTTFHYSNTDYAILSAVIEQQAGQPFAAAMNQTLFEPLSLERTALCSAALPDLAVGYNIGPDGPIVGPELP
jgi:CubicO group peptidase (beta-lactamase class C family)